jgi:hypothetical protein
MRLMSKTWQGGHKNVNVVPIGIIRHCELDVPRKQGRSSSVNSMYDMQHTTIFSTLTRIDVHRTHGSGLARQ